jgi:hypothetical protein
LIFLRRQIAFDIIAELKINQTQVSGKYPFFVQVKTSKTMNRQFKKANLNQWENYPIPVILFLVKIPEYRVYAKTLSEINISESNNKTLSIKFDENDNWELIKRRPGGRLMTKSEVILQLIKSFHRNTDATSSYTAIKRAKERHRWRSVSQNIKELCLLLWKWYRNIQEEHRIDLLSAGTRNNKVHYPIAVAELEDNLLQPSKGNVEKILGPDGNKSPGSIERSIGANTLAPYILGNYPRRDVAITSVNPAQLFDGLTFALDSVNWNNCTRKLESINFFCGRYFDMLDTCDCFEIELLDYLSSQKDKNNFSNTDLLLQNLRLRRCYHDLFLKYRPEFAQSPGELLFLGDGRSPAVAITTMVLFETQKDVCFFLGKRANQGVAIQAGMNHLIPGGQFQPEWKSNNIYKVLKRHRDHVSVKDLEFEQEIKQEFSITEHILREYVEEIFGKNPVFESDFQTETHDARWYRNEESCIELLQMMDEGNALLTTTGVVWSLLNTRAEICTLLWIKDHDWYKRNVLENKIKINDEWTPAKQVVNSNKNQQWYVVLPEFRSRWKTVDYENYLLSKCSKFIGPEHIVPVGGGAFWLGLKWLREYGEF